MLAHSTTLDPVCRRSHYVHFNPSARSKPSAGHHSQEEIQVLPIDRMHESSRSLVDRHARLWMILYIIQIERYYRAKILSPGQRRDHLTTALLTRVETVRVIVTHPSLRATPEVGDEPALVQRRRGICKSNINMQLLTRPFYRTITTHSLLSTSFSKLARSLPSLRRCR